MKPAQVVVKQRKYPSKQSTRKAPTAKTNHEPGFREGHEHRESWEKAVDTPPATKAEISHLKVALVQTRDPKKALHKKSKKSEQFLTYREAKNGAKHLPTRREGRWAN